MKALTPRAGLLILVYAGIMAVLGGYSFFYKYGFAELRRVSAEIGGVSALLAGSEGVLAQEQAVDLEYARVQEKLRSGKSGENVTTEILQDIKSKAQEAGLNVINIKPFGLKHDAGSMYGTFDFKLETEGNLTNLGSFLYRLDDSPYLFGVKHSQINSHVQDGLLKFQLLLSALVTQE